ncbi:MAG: glutamate-5-semialdehyde dehydrogenase [Caldilineae bacterium]|nr:MAG: glutamate-5-semialdehyde dehydrogenase [Caldilineae bacterium]
MNSELETLGKQARAAARWLAQRNGEQKNRALHILAETIMEHEPDILGANDEDVEGVQKGNPPEHRLARLTLTPQGLERIAESVLHIARLPEPVGEDLESRVLPNGLRISKRRIPIGVIGVIYENRPAVTVELAALCLKSGNAAILHGGPETHRTNRVFAGLVTAACTRAGLPEHAVQLAASADRSLLLDMLRGKSFLDLIIVRGSADLRRLVEEYATVPVISNDAGVCHIYVDAKADPDKVTPILLDAKARQPHAHNAMNTLLIHQAVAEYLLPPVARAFAQEGIEMRCGPRALSILQGFQGVTAAEPDDFDTEFRAAVAAVKVVSTLEEALEHIYAHSTRHTEAIITEDYRAAMRFVNAIASSAVLVNASTRFNNGHELGLGVEAAISTRPLHARGPLGLKELTTCKWVILGDGQVKA